MPRQYKILICGDGGVGKSAIVLSMIYPNFQLYNQKLMPTYEDTYSLCVDTDKGREKLRIYEIGSKHSNNMLPKHIINAVDAVLFVYDPSNPSSFAKVQELKDLVIFITKNLLLKIDRNREKRDILYFIVVNKFESVSDDNIASKKSWAASEKIHSGEVEEIGHCSTIHTSDSKLIFSGHSKGYVAVWNLLHRKTLYTWKASNASIISLFVLPIRVVESTLLYFILSQGRENQIRIWNLSIDANKKFTNKAELLPGKKSGSISLICLKVESYLECCSFTFCGFTARVFNAEMIEILYIIGESTQSVGFCKITNFISSKPSINTFEMIKTEELKDFGMPMCIEFLKNNSKMYYLIGFESGHILLCEETKISYKFEKFLPRSIMCISVCSQVQLNDDRELFLVSVGMTPYPDEMSAQKPKDDSTFENLIVKIDNHNCEIKIYKTGRQQIKNGISHLSWCPNGEVLAISCWNGTCLLWQPTKNSEKAIISCLCLSGCQYLPADDLIGDWSSTREWDKRGGRPTLNNESLRTLHACCFFDNQILLTGIPAGTSNSYVSSTLALWDLNNK